MDRKRKTLVIAHRAAAPGCPENSLVGIRAAAGCGVDIVEVDVRRTLNGVPVLLHDRTMRRTAGGLVPVRLLPKRWVTTRRLLSSPGSGPQTGETAPTLGAALAALREGVEIGIHIKDRGTLPATLGVIMERGAAERAWLWLEQAEDVAVARARLPGVRVTLLNDWRRFRSLDRYLEAAAGATAVSVPWGQVTPDTTAEAHRRGLLVFAAERNPDELLAKVAAGLDGVITDGPARAAAMLESLG